MSEVHKFVGEDGNESENLFELKKKKAAIKIILETANAG
jgi:hypothetical protein